MTRLPLSPHAPSFLFESKFADVEALGECDPSRLRVTLDDSTRRHLESAHRGEPETALVLGANGYVGAHLIARLSREPSLKKIHAMVRPQQGQTPEQRLDAMFKRYGIDVHDPRKITPLAASPTLPRFGLDEQRYRTLAEGTDLVFSSASATEYDVSYLDLRNDWVLGLLQVLQFCTEGRPKHLSYLGSIGAKFYQSREDALRPDSWWYSGYCQMKWVNGSIIETIAKDALLPVTLCEAPYIFGSTTRGVDPGLVYSYWRILEIAKSIKTMYAGPGMNYCPVDVLVDVLAVNALARRPLGHLRPCNVEPYDNELLATLLGCSLASWDEFHEQAGRSVSKRRMDTLLCTNFNELVRKTNLEALYPPGYETSWADNARLMQLYLQHVPFRDVRTSARSGPGASPPKQAVDAGAASTSALPGSIAQSYRDLMERTPTNDTAGLGRRLGAARSLAEAAFGGRDRAAWSAAQVALWRLQRRSRHRPNHGGDLLVLNTLHEVEERHVPETAIPTWRTKAEFLERLEEKVRSYTVHATPMASVLKNEALSVSEWRYLGYQWICSAVDFSRQVAVASLMLPLRAACTLYANLYDESGQGHWDRAHLVQLGNCMAQLDISIDDEQAMLRWAAPGVIAQVNTLNRLLLRDGAASSLGALFLVEKMMPVDVALMGAALERSGIARYEEYFLGHAEADVDHAREWVDLMAEVLRTEHEQRQAYAAAVELGEAQAAAWRAAHAGLEQLRRTGKFDRLPFDELA